MAPQNSSTFRPADVFVPEIQELLAEQNFREMKDVLHSLSLVDLADVWEKFTPKEQTLLFRLLSGRNASILFQELEPDEQSHILNTLGQKELEGLLDDFNPEEAARLFHELDSKTVRRLSTHMEKEQRKSVEQIYKYPDNSVGSWLRIQHVSLQPNLTTAQALERIRAGARLRLGGGPDGYYVVDTMERPVGYLSLRKLIAAPPRMRLNDYMTPVRFLKLNPLADQEEAAHLFSTYRLSMAPVVDDNGGYVGYIQAEDILSLVEEEVSEDFAKMAGTEAEEFETDSVLSAARLRFPWLIATCAGQLLVAAVIHHFSYVLSQVIALASFLPFIVAMGGNVGSQSSTILVRSLAIREYDFSDRWKLLVKETSIGCLLGVIYGGIIAAMAWGIYGDQFGSNFSWVIGLATVISMTVATISGVVGPLTLVRFGIDPATATGPLITTTTDIIGTILYFVLAISLLI